MGLVASEDVIGSNRHIRGDLRDYLDEGWDFLAVCHPPCTRLCNSGVRWLHVPPPGRSLAEMWAELDEGAALFSACWRAPIARVAIENPVMHKHARARLPADLPRPQIVQPWWFGDPAFKATGWYLRGLPALVPTNRLVPPRKAEEPERHAEWSAIHRASPGPDRWKIRSRTFQGLAEACADQWGGFVDQQQEATHG
ncbi:hypothetical protein PUH89_08555 [Rhodobacter capsulatus]|uniref:hypothetical protein n=1 Tax=Rhodobacter capsulatus TaxID=1061 RepID=UPI0023E1F973|nr:hypothetical protein [Rhodobacter capsulatus]WER11222.1 hypothetical protein PUH89_08555 [Rhodobacter capsulatus]